jgi:hypothetical protein
LLSFETLSLCSFQKTYSTAFPAFSSAFDSASFVRQSATPFSNLLAYSPLVGERTLRGPFCGRVPNSVLARHYTDFSPERLKEIYDQAGLKILSESEI